LSSRGIAVVGIASTIDNDLCGSDITIVSGVPGAGKTLVGLNIATKHIDKSNDLYSVFLSGNGPLVAILREALARDKIRHEREVGRKMKKGEALSEVKMFIQNVHHFRDDCLTDTARPPVEHVAIFDEAQRAWHAEKLSKRHEGLGQSEPDLVLDIMTRPPKWSVVLALVGGGQEIHDGEAGLQEWGRSISRASTKWEVVASPDVISGGASVAGQRWLSDA
jgi:hypothetical protein